MKWRNQILALICLLAFAALGVLYFQNWVVQKPFGIILFVGEGLTAQRTAATRVYIGGADNPLAMDGLEFSARLRNHSADFAVPDSAAAASALATGIRVKNGTIAIAESGAPLQTILEIAHQEGRATGIVTDGALTNPTVAAFYAHANTAKPPQQFATAMIDQSVVDIALGGGAADFDKAKARSGACSSDPQFAGAGTNQRMATAAAAGSFCSQRLAVYRRSCSENRPTFSRRYGATRDRASPGEPSWLCPHRECSFDGVGGMAKSWRTDTSRNGRA